MIVGSMVVNVVNYIYHLVMGRVLGPSDYGTLVALYSLLYIVSIIPLSTSFAIVKFISSAKTSREQAGIYVVLNKFIFKIAIAGTILIVVLSPILSKFLNVSSVWEVALVGPVLFFSLVTLVNQATMQGLLSFMGVVGPNIISSVSKFVLGLALVFLGFSVIGAMWGVVLAAAAAYFLSLTYIRSKIKRDGIENFKISKFLKFSFPVLVLALAFTSIFTTDLILVKHFFSSFDAGIYAALSMLGKIIYFAASPITSVMFPIVSRRNSKGEKFLKVFLLSFGATLFICLGALSIYFVFPGLFVSILYGQKYLMAVDNLIWMGLFLSFYTLNYFMSNFFMSIGKTQIAYIPLVIAIFQAISIWIYHPSLLSIIQVSLGLMVALFLILLTILGYNMTHGEIAKN